MFTRLLSFFEDPSLLLANPLLLLLTVFQIWMLIHALRNRRIWALFIAIGFGIGAVCPQVLFSVLSPPGRDRF